MFSMLAATGCTMCVGEEAQANTDRYGVLIGAGTPGSGSRPLEARNASVRAPTTATAAAAALRLGVRLSSMAADTPGASRSTTGPSMPVK